MNWIESLKSKNEVSLFSHLVCFWYFPISCLHLVVLNCVVQINQCYWISGCNFLVSLFSKGCTIMFEKYQYINDDTLSHTREIVSYQVIIHQQLWSKKFLDLVFKGSHKINGIFIFGTFWLLWFTYFDFFRNQSFKDVKKCHIICLFHFSAQVQVAAD